MQNLVVKKKRVLLICVIAVALGLIAYPRLRRSSEPSYGGHPLSYWVTQLAAGSHIEDFGVCGLAIALYAPEVSVVPDTHGWQMNSFTTDWISQ